MVPTIDCRGLTCPQPVINTKKLVAESHPAELHVLVDNPASLENVSRFLARNGYAVSSAEKGAGVWRIKGEGGGAPDAEIKDAEYVACAVPGAQPKTLVLITADTLGRGDDALGTALMGNFLATLPELGSQLWRVVLLNGGVKLASTEGKALDGLKKLAEMGVSILVCGTCLEHYKLLDKKLVGETTNMLDIVTSLSLADKVIRP